MMDSFRIEKAGEECMKICFIRKRSTDMRGTRSEPTLKSIS